MITVETLAQEIGRVGQLGHVRDRTRAYAADPAFLVRELLPFIKRHIAAGQQGITAEWVKGYFQRSYTPAANLQAVDDAFTEWAALHPTATPKPAGAVPAGEPVAMLERALEDAHRHGLQSAPFALKDCVRKVAAAFSARHTGSQP